MGGTRRKEGGIRRTIGSKELRPNTDIGTTFRVVPVSVYYVFGHVSIGRSMEGPGGVFRKT